VLGYRRLLINAVKIIAIALTMDTATIGSPKRANMLTLTS
jgi:hypothetical protein